MPKSYELELEDYWRIIKRRKAIVLVAFVVITSAVFLHNSRMTPTYRAQTTLKVERQFGGEAGQVDWDTDFIETQMQVITSRGVAYEAASLAGEIKEGADEKTVEEAIAKYQGVTTTRRGRTNIFDIKVESDRPDEAARLTDQVAQGYQSWSLKDKSKKARQVREFVEKQLNETHEKLQGREQDLKKFQEDSPLGASIAGLQQQRINLELQMSDLLEKYTARHPEVVEIQAQLYTLSEKLGRYPELELQYSQLTRDVESLKGIYAQLKQRHEEARTNEAQNISGVSILNPATIPESPVAPNIPRNTIIGGIVALVLGLLLAFVKENVDTSISTIEEVEDFLQIPILGVIPEMTPQGEDSKHWDWKGWLNKIVPIRSFQRSTSSDVTDVEELRKMIMLSGVHHQFSPLEAYKTLRTNLLFAVGDKKGVALAVTSAGAREGKSLTSLNISLTLAQSGNKVCLISADLRRESICRMMGVSKEPGLTDILTKGTPWKEVLRKTTDFLVGKLPPDRILQTIGIDNFYLLGPGRLPLNPAELLSLKEFETLIKELKSEFDFVIVDTPPVLPVSDPSIIAQKMDGLVLVYHVGRTARGALKRAKVQIAGTGVKILGVILNNIKAAEMRMAPSYYYYYEYYGPDEQVVRERRKQKDRERAWWRKIFSKAA